MLTEGNHYMIVTLDAHTIDLEPYQYSGTNFTLVRIVNPASPLMDAFSEYMKNFEPGSEQDDADEDTNGPSMRDNGYNVASREDNTAETEGMSKFRIPAILQVNTS